MKQVFNSCVLLLAIFSLSACSLIYRPAKQEGALIVNQQIQQVHTGQSKEQVQYILGYPTAILQQTDDVWYYITRNVSSHDSVQQKVFEVKFDNDKVVSFGYVSQAQIPAQVNKK